MVSRVCHGTHEPAGRPTLLLLSYLPKKRLYPWEKEQAEVKRHYALREHFRRDQKWRYTHLSRTDPITGNVSHYVRDKKRNLLEKLEPELGVPKFFDEELMELGDKLHFYEDFNASRENVTPSNSCNYSKLCFLEII